MRLKHLFTYNPIKLVTFDVTGTLIKFKKSPVDIYRETALKHGIEVSKEDLLKSFRTQWVLLNKTDPHFGKCWIKWWTKFVISTFENADQVQTDLKPSSFQTALSTISSELINDFSTANYWELQPSALKLLKFLKEDQGLTIGVISNFDSRIHKILSELDISSYFEFIVISHEAQFSKPQKEIFQLALNQGRNKFQKELSQRNQHQNFNQIISEKNVIHFGDNLELDVVGGLGAGFNSCLVGSLNNENLKNINREQFFIYPDIGSILRELKN